MKTGLALGAALLAAGCNRAPVIPAAPAGPDSGRANFPHTFSAVTTDPEGDSLAYQFSWGSNRLSRWSGLVASGVPDSQVATWPRGGSFPVRVRARDARGRESDWSPAREFRVANDGGINWSVDLGGPAAGAPVQTGPNIVFPLAGGGLVCLDTAGAEQWRVTLPGEINGTPAAGAGGRLFVTCANTRVYAYGPGGVKAWERLVGFGCFAPALGPQGQLYAGATDGRLYSFDQDDGRILGFFQADEPVRAPCVVRADGVILFGCDDGNLYAVNPDFSLRWRYPVGGRLRQAPALGADREAYIGADDSRLYAVSPDGQLLWSCQADGRVKGEPAVGWDGSIRFGADDNRLYRVSRAGEIIGRFETGGFVRACPTLADNGRVYLGSYDNRLYALDEADELLWRVEGDGAVLYSALLEAGGNVYFMVGSTAYSVAGVGEPAGSPWPTGRQNQRRTATP